MTWEKAGRTVRSIAIVTTGGQLKPVEGRKWERGRNIEKETGVVAMRAPQRATAAAEAATTTAGAAARVTAGAAATVVVPVHVPPPPEPPCRWWGLWM